MTYVTFKLRVEHAEALSQMGKPEKRSRVGQMERLIETAWDKHSNGAPLPRSATKTPVEDQAYKQTRKRIIEASVSRTIMENGTTEDLKEEVEAACARAGIKFKPLEKYEIEYFFMRKAEEED